MFYNPAGLGGLDRDSLNLSLSAFTTRFTRIENGYTVRFGTEELSENLSFNEFLPVPSALVYVRQITPTISAALGIYVVESSDLRLDARIEGADVPVGDQELDIRTGLDVQELRTTYNVGVGLGWRITQNLHMGGGLYVLYERRISSTLLFTSRETGAGTSDSTLLTSDDDIKSAGFRASYGLQWSPVRGLHLGLALHSPSVGVYTWGTSLPVTTVAADGLTVLQAEQVELSDFDVEFIQPFLAEAMLSLDLDAWTLGATFEVGAPLETDRFSFDALWNLRLGATYQAKPTLKFGAGFFTDRASARSLTEPNLPEEVDFYGWTLGAFFKTFLNEEKTVAFTSSFGLLYRYGRGQVNALTLDPTSLVPTVILEPQRSIVHEAALNVGSGIEY